MPITYHKKKVGTGENIRNYYYKRLANGNSKRIRKEVYERNQVGGNNKAIVRLFGVLKYVNSAYELDLKKLFSEIYKPEDIIIYKLYKVLLTGINYDLCFGFILKEFFSKTKKEEILGKMKLDSLYFQNVERSSVILAINRNIKNKIPILEPYEFNEFNEFKKYFNFKSNFNLKRHHEVDEENIIKNYFSTNYKANANAKAKFYKEKSNNIKKYYILEKEFLNDDVNKLGCIIYKSGFLKFEHNINNFKIVKEEIGYPISQNIKDTEIKKDDILIAVSIDNKIQENKEIFPYENLEKTIHDAVKGRKQIKLYFYKINLQFTNTENSVKNIIKKNGNIRGVNRKIQLSTVPYNSEHDSLVRDFIVMVNREPIPGHKMESKIMKIVPHF